MEITGKYINRGAGYGLEVPCVFRFHGPEKFTARLSDGKVLCEELNRLIYLSLYNTFNAILSLFRSMEDLSGAISFLYRSLYGIQRVRYSEV